MTDRGKGNVPAGGRSGDIGGYTRKKFETANDVHEHQKPNAAGELEWWYVDLPKKSVYDSSVIEVVDPNKKTLSVVSVEVTSLSVNSLSVVNQALTPIYEYKVSTGDIGLTTLTASFAQLTGSGTAVTVCDDQGNQQVLTFLTPGDFVAANALTSATLNNNTGYLKADAAGGITLLSNAGANEVGKIFPDSVSSFECIKEDPAGAIKALTENVGGSIEIYKVDPSGTTEMVIAAGTGVDEFEAYIKADDPCGGGGDRKLAVLAPILVELGDPCAPEWEELEFYEAYVPPDGITTFTNRFGQPLSLDPLRIYIPQRIVL